jgi:hypothetical protein
MIRGKSQNKLPGPSSSEGNPQPEYVAYVLIFCQSALVEGQKLFDQGPNPISATLFIAEEDKELGYTTTDNAETHLQAS